MAQRTGCGMRTAASDMTHSFCFGPVRESKERQPVPARARHRRCNGAEGAIAPPLKFETIAEYFHDNAGATIVPFQHCARTRDPPIEVRTAAAVDRIVRIHKSRRWQNPHIRFVSNFLSALVCRLAQPALCGGLQTPGQAPQQVFAVLGTRLLLKHLPILEPNLREGSVAQLLDLPPNGIHSFSFLVCCGSHLQQFTWTLF